MEEESTGILPPYIQEFQDAGYTIPDGVSWRSPRAGQDVAMQMMHRSLIAYLENPDPAQFLPPSARAWEKAFNRGASIVYQEGDITPFVAGMLVALEEDVFSATVPNPRKAYEDLFAPQP